MLDSIASVNGVINGIVWGTFGIALLFISGVVMSVLNRGFQFKYFSHWWKMTIGAIFNDKHVTAHTEKDDKQISQFQS